MTVKNDFKPMAVLRQMVIFVGIVSIGLGCRMLAVSSQSGPSLQGFSAANAQREQQWESKFRAIPSAQIIRDTNRFLSAYPHNAGSARDRQNAVLENSISGDGRRILRHSMYCCRCRRSVLWNSWRRIDSEQGWRSRRLQLTLPAISIRNNCRLITCILLMGMSRPPWSM